MDTTNGTIIATSPNVDWANLSQWTVDRREAIAVDLHGWVLSQTDASAALRDGFESDALSHRVAVWLACALARTVLAHVPMGDDRPRLAIETTERWVRGQATIDECCQAARAALIFSKRSDQRYDVCVGAVSAAYDAAYSSAYPSQKTAYYAAKSAACSIACAKISNAEFVNIEVKAAAYREAYTSALRELCGVIARELRTALEAASEGYTRHPISR